jgi:hypothetical protein
MYKKCERKSKKTWHSLTSEAFSYYIYKVIFCFFFHIFCFWSHYISTHVLINNFWILVVPSEGAYIRGRYGYQTLLWKGPLGRWQISCKVPWIDGEGNGIGEKGALFNFLQTFPCLWSYTWAQVFARNSSPLWQQLGPKMFIEKLQMLVYSFINKE